MGVDDILKVFRNFIDAALPHLNSSFENDDNYILDDWYQANWEIVVEYFIQKKVKGRIFINIYGDGADCNGASSRVFAPDAIATHKITCAEIASGKSFDFIKFVGFYDDENYGDVSPFTHALCKGHNLIKITDAKFQLIKLDFGFSG